MNINKYTICNSPTEKVLFENREIYIKRDDLLHPDFSGNKARKFYYYLLQDFPDIKKVVSYGSNQSNAMYSLSVLAKAKGWEFEYYTDHIPSYLRDSPIGNYKYALQNGMKLIVGRGKPKKEEIEDISTVFIEEGGRDQNSYAGIRVLAREIISWQQQEGIDELNIFLPSGTGTTALFLQKALVEFSQNSLESETFSKRVHSTRVPKRARLKPSVPSFIDVYTTPCVGDSDYLKLQFEMLEKNPSKHPHIVKPPKKYHFGKLYRDSYEIWLKLRDSLGIEFDMLYDPIGWLTLMSTPKIFEKPTLYIHQGGAIGNESMIQRYKRKYGEDI